MKKCTTCNNTPCGCSDNGLTTYSSTPTCPTPQVCSEFTYTGCLIYNGPEISELCIAPGMNFNDIIQALVLLTSNTACVSTECPAHSPYISVISTTKTTIDVGWGLIDDVLSYTVSYTLEDASPLDWTDIVVSPSTAHQVIFGLTCGTTYLIKVSISYGSGPSTCESVTIKATTSDC